MEAQQIRLHINELVSGIRDESFLNACYEAVAGIAKAYKQIKEQTNGATPEVSDVEAQLPNEAVQPHDLGIVLLANEVLRGSEPMPEEAILAFEDALFEVALSEPTLPNRL